MHSLIQQMKLLQNKTLASMKTLKNRTECYYLYFYDIAYSYNSIQKELFVRNLPGADVYFLEVI